MSHEASDQKSIPLDRDIFFRSLIRELAGVLEEIVGIKDASGFVSIVGQRIGEEINGHYRSALGTEQLDRAQVARYPGRSEAPYRWRFFCH
jgi:hypothetical protein